MLDPKRRTRDHLSAAEARGLGTIDLNHTTFALVNVPVTAAPRIRLAVAAPSGTSAALALVGSTSSGRVEIEKKPASGGHGQITLTNPGNLRRLPQFS